MRHADLHAEREPHVLFQASTIGALLEGPTRATSPSPSWPSAATWGWGRSNHLDGEMIALDGRFYRADVKGAVNEVDGSTADAVRGGERLRPAISRAGSA